MSSPRISSFALALWIPIQCFAGAPASAVDLTTTNGATSKIPVVVGPELWKDPSQPLDVRVRDLVSRLSLKEKVSLMSCDEPAIPRLGIPAYSYRNECLHGIMTDGAARKDFATVFPQAIGMAATWDPALIRQEADVISTEARGRHNAYVAKHHGNSAHRFGLNFYSPNLNLFRDPRWGRGQETYGEDPFLIAQMDVAFIRGLQGDDPKYLKAIACAKHFAVHSGPETERHKLNARPPLRDLYDTYLPAFEAAVREGHVGSVMGAYSALYGVPDCANPFLLTDLLRNQWGFDGFVVSDGGAIWDIWAQHKYVPTPEAAAAAAVKAGCDLASGNVRPNARTLRRSVNWTPDTLGWLHGGEDFAVLTNAVEDGLISEKDIDAAVSADLAARFRLGLFDPPTMVPWSKLGLNQVDTPEDQTLALKVAEESIVLLKNNGLLPLDRAKIKRLAVIGPNANSTIALLGSYHGRPSHPVTILEGIKELAGTNTKVSYNFGCPLVLRKDGSNKPASEELAQTIAAAKAADVVIYVGGIDSTLEKEESNARGGIFDGFHRGDRTRIELPPVQEALLKALRATGKPVVFVNCSGSAIAMPWEARHLPAIVQAWYPGEQGGRAVAKVLFGDVNPAGRLPITFYRATSDLPPFDDYSMSNRTYRYFRGKPLFAFGHGLSYTRFRYGRASLNDSRFTADDTVELTFTLKNTGTRAGDEVAQVYFRHLHSVIPQPRLALCGFTRVHLKKGQSAQVTIAIPASRFRQWDAALQGYTVEPGDYELLLGAASDDIRRHVRLQIVTCLAPSRAPRPGDAEPRTGDEIVAAGQFFHTGTKVVLWMDPGGYDAYRVERRFSPFDQSDWQTSHRENPELETPNRYGLRKDDLTPEQIEEVRGGGWNLPLLRQVVDQFVIHFDAEGTSRRCFRTLQDVRDLSVQFMLDVDGTIYQTLDLKERAWHATISNTRSIGIEIANVGAYPVGGKNPFAKWYMRTNGQTVLTIPDAFGAAGIRTPGFIGHPARPFPIEGNIQGKDLVQYDFTPQQYQALIKLTATLCRIFPKIKCRYPTDSRGRLITHKLPNAELKSYEGILGHYHIQTNKVDPGPAFRWDYVINGARKLLRESGGKSSTSSAGAHW